MILEGVPKFKTDKDLFSFIVENEEALFIQAKSIIKEADGIFTPTTTLFNNPINSINKTLSLKDLLNKDEVDVQAVINTTYLIDSHKDLHVNGLWDEELKMSGDRMLHVQEHKSNQFDKIISSGPDLKAFTKEFTWKQLGYNAEGKTEALVFDSSVKKSRNEYMFEQYVKGYVTNHSVGMYYKTLVTCINDEDYPTQKENFDKYIELAVNPEAAGKYFWAVLEAKAIEGSAVPAGSNPITPTNSVKNPAVDQKDLKEAKKQIRIKAYEKWLKSN